MFSIRNAYYQLKPFIPRHLRIEARKFRAARRKVAYSDVWPISESAGRKPAKWPGWPEGKKFALVLTHDVEGIKGAERCRQLAEVEARLGFRSSFNLIPEGEYPDSKSLREYLVAHGFEVGVHDLRHDGKLYLTRSAFSQNAEQINRYLQDWKVGGFRSGFMHNRLNWLHELKVHYDASTFDTDPFEPQPEGVDTIFPFWVGAADGTGYMELPYTLTQDFTLFILLGEKSTDIWERKVDWIAERGGMALVNTHPDYIHFDSDKPCPPFEFPIKLYEDFLSRIRTKYGGQYWHVLPRELATFTAGHRTHLRLRRTPHNAISHRAAWARSKRIWIDLDNTPHIPFFKPLIRELESRGYGVLLTARDAYQVCEMAGKYGLEPQTIGRHYGKYRLMKLLGFFYRTLQLASFALREKPTVALNHGSRSQVFLCNLLGIPSITIMDYEHGRGLPLVRPTWLIVPDAYPKDIPGFPPERTRRYDGIKEDVYVPEFAPDGAILPALGLSPKDLIVTVRPPATEAHYHNPEGELLFRNFVDRVCAADDSVKAVILPRNKRQESQIRSDYPHWFKNGKVIIPATVVDGLNLLWHSDLAVSGGGTMNREAAALGVPVYSIFRGVTAAVDVRLQEEGRLTLIQSVDEVHCKIRLERRPRNASEFLRKRQAMPQILGYLEEILGQYRAHL